MDKSTRWSLPYKDGPDVRYASSQGILIEPRVGQIVSIPTTGRGDSWHTAASKLVSVWCPKVLSEWGICPKTQVTNLVLPQLLQ